MSKHFAVRAIFLSLLVMLCAVLLTACGRSAGDTGESKNGVGSANSQGRALVVYFSRADENTGGVGYIERGNTRILAEMIAERTKAELFEIKPAKPYPKEYTPTTEIAKREQEEKVRPEILGELPDVQQYDVIFLGYPIWWGDLPMAVYTFLEKENFAGKTIIPFCTHEGSGIGNTERFIADATKAKVLEGLELRGNLAQNSRDEAKRLVTEWLEGLGY